MHALRLLVLLCALGGLVPAAVAQTCVNAGSCVVVPTNQWTALNAYWARQSVRILNQEERVRALEAQVLAQQAALNTTIIFQRDAACKFNGLVFRLADAAQAILPLTMPDGADPAGWKACPDRTKSAPRAADVLPVWTPPIPTQ